MQHWGHCSSSTNMPAQLQPPFVSELMCPLPCLQDMTRLSYLHEPGVLWNLKSRYTYDDIYTYTGSILIAVNPFAALPHLYGPHMMDHYRGVELGDLSPHVYAIADAAYRQMRKEWKGQSILVRPGGCMHPGWTCRGMAGSNGWLAEGSGCLPAGGASRVMCITTRHRAGAGNQPNDPSCHQGLNYSVMSHARLRPDWCQTTSSAW
jgi:hypothetical protein